ncbi:MAG TPA: TIGR03013 family XrtA/PEP-CTERM system glycosyltransferase [Terriglobales bacterium]|nr:TIGR03013 family XrtA/PEP-CTERM system glycosyltransferase [Terriglobales bacterium]
MTISGIVRYRALTTLGRTSVIRIFSVYYPVRTLLLVAGEVLVVWFSFLLATVAQARENSYFALNDDFGYHKIVVVTFLVVLLSHWFDLYDPASFLGRGEFYFRPVLIPGMLALGVALVGMIFPHVLRNFSFLLGTLIVTIGLVAWRSAYLWVAQQPYLKERVYVLGSGDRARRLVDGLQNRIDLGVEVVGWSGCVENPIRSDMAEHLIKVAREKRVHRVIVAMQDRRGTMPVDELLKLRLEGVTHIEEAASWLEKISGKIDVEHLQPSWIIFAEGFRSTQLSRSLRRMLDVATAFGGLILSAPVLPLVMIAIKLDSPGPVLYQQSRVGRLGKLFLCYKFRTMRADAEADLGPTWAGDNDSRITRTGKFLRMSRLDEIPQLWCVLKGDMSLVGPRPERPEFVEWLSKDLPYYRARHVVRPGITGWAQVKYKYGNTVEDAQEKLQYDLFYIKNASIGLDVLIMFHTIKTVLLRRGAR